MNIKKEVYNKIIKLYEKELFEIKYKLHKNKRNITELADEQKILKAERKQIYEILNEIRPKIKIIEDKEKEWIPVPAPINIKAFKYDGKNQVLSIKMKDRNVYDYYDIPFSIFEGMKKADMKGQYLTKYIKGNYRYARQ